MKSEFALAFNEVLEERGLPRDVIMAALESAMISAYHKAVGASAVQDVQVVMDFDNGNVSVFAEKEVSDTITDYRTEVLLEEARKYDPNAQIGDLVMVESTPKDFGRIAASTAKQAIQQKIRDAEKQRQFEHFSKQVNEITSGIVQAVNSRQATIGLDMKAEGIMQKKEMIPNERFRIHERIRALIVSVTDTNKGLQIELSRAHRNFLRRLLENEVPEIYHGIVEIRSIAREPGQRAKVAVSATQQGIDPVGACVGQRGVRIQAIVRELHDEKIDVIEWSPDAAVYISKAISPARVSGVYLNPSIYEHKTATVVVPEDQLSLAIGREGQNARLAAKLTGWRIDIMSISEAAAKALIKLREDPSLAALAEKEADTMARVEELLQMKSEGRILNMDDSTLIGRFVDRVERRGEADRKDEVDAHMAELKAVRDEIDPRAFDIKILDVPGIKEHILVTLSENNLETFGDLIFVVRTNPDKIMGFNGIGPKFFEEILDVVNNYEFPPMEVEETVEVAQPEEIEATAGVEVPEEVAIPEVTEVEPVEEIEVVEEPELVSEVAEPALVGSETETSDDKSFEELFRLDSLRRDKTTIEDEEDLNQLGASKKKKGKKRRGFTVEYDPDQDTDVVHYQRRKNEDDWEQW
ncbi:MAG: transcription termination factor NusA [Anaerolineaceae bacterium]|jgi:N utilization substance protein A|nr:transcription termination factor NusA [Anaerolineaceae bacterium]MDD4043172.1 transcription termination factor NusA [Anaerolineaceae bacterium]MDD4578430.1 transcription termination factor NusA [Anaerolineaceae bacterium]